MNEEYDIMCAGCGRNPVKDDQIFCDTCLGGTVFDLVEDDNDIDEEQDE